MLCLLRKFLQQVPVTRYNGNTIIIYGSQTPKMYWKKKHDLSELWKYYTQRKFVGHKSVTL